MTWDRKSAIRTDLAAESRTLWREETDLGAEAPEGVTWAREERDGFPVEVVEIRTEAGAKELCKPIGRYATVLLDALNRREEGAFRRACGTLAEELRRQLALTGEEPVLVVGLGNRDITPDAVGPLAAGQVLVTRHLKERMPEEFRGFRPVSVFCSGVLGTTGLESAALTAAVSALAAPGRVIAVDALCARETGRLCRTVQISDAGIVPGSGVGNARQALDREGLGVPVVAIGVPTVVDARTLCTDLGGSPPAEEPGTALFVTPRDIDSRVRDAARLVGYSINLALHPGLTIEDIDMFLS